MKYTKVRIVNRTFFLKVTELEKKEIEGDENTGFKVLKTYTSECTRKDLEESFEEDRKNGISHKVEIVDSEPEKFQIDTLYVRRDGKFAYVYVIREN